MKRNGISLKIELSIFKEVVINTKKSFWGLLKNNRGFSLAEVMIAALMVGGLALVLFQLSKDQAGQTVKSKVNSDVAQFRSEVQSILLNPSHCNANIYTKVVGSNTATAIYTCPAGSSCRPGTPDIKFPVHTTSWAVSSTKISDRVRVKSVSIDINGVVAGTTALSTAVTTITLETKPNLPRTTSVGAGTTAEVLKDEVINVTIPIIMNGNTVVGCPKSWNSTVPY